MTTEHVWRVVDDDPEQYYLASSVPDMRVFSVPGNRYSLCDYLNALEAAAEALEPAKEMIATLSAHIPDAWAEDRPRAGELTTRLALLLVRLRELRGA